MSRHLLTQLNREWLTAALVATLVEHNLIDEYRLMVFPIVLGSGRRLFPESPDKKVLKLVDTQTFPSDVVVHTYHRAG